MTTVSPVSPVSPINLYGICGNAGVGKDTFAEVFHEFSGFRQYSFAGPVKEVVCAAFGIDKNNFVSRELKEEVIPYWGVSPRKLAQLVGTELFRTNVSPTHWIELLQFKLFLEFDSKESTRAVISDVRFQNEAQWILENGGALINLTRPGYTGNVGIPNHASEAGIDFDSLIIYSNRKDSITHIENADTRVDLYKKALTYITTQINEITFNFTKVY